MFRPVKDVNELKATLEREGLKLMAVKGSATGKPMVRIVKTVTDSIQKQFDPIDTQIAYDAVKKADCDFFISDNGKYLKIFRSWLRYCQEENMLPPDLRGKPLEEIPEELRKYASKRSKK